MKVEIGEDGGVIVAFDGDFIKISAFDGGLLSVIESRLLSDVLRVMADHLELNEVA